MSNESIRDRLTRHAINYLRQVETHEEIISSNRSDYDAYFISLVAPREKASSDEEPPTLTERLARTRYVVKKVEGSDFIVEKARDSAEEERNPNERVGYDITKNCHFELFHVYGRFQFDYRSPVSAYICRITGLFFARWLWAVVYTAVVARLSQLFLREVRDRKRVLDAVIKMEEAGKPDIYYLSVAEQLHGRKFFNVSGPRFKLEIDQIQRLIDSLEYSGELKQKRKGEFTFSTTPKAISSSIEWQREVKKERHRVIMDGCMIIFTGVLALSAALQV